MKGMRWSAVFLLFLFFFLSPAGARADSGPALTISPNVSEVLLEGPDANGVNHVLRSSPSFGVAAELSYKSIVGNWAPGFSFATRELRFTGANGEFIQYGALYFNSYQVGLENQLLDRWVAAGWVGYSQQLFLRAPDPSTLWVDTVSTPTVTLSTSVGVYQYDSFLLSANAKAIGYFPVTTPYYTSSFGYALEPSLSTTHVFNSHVSGTAEIFYLKRIQNTSAYNLIEQDAGLALSILLE